MKTSQGNFNASLSQMYDGVTDADYYSMFFDSIFHYLDQEEVKGKKVLDIGCGNGRLCNRFLQQGASEILGIDISEDQIQRARKQNPNQACHFIIQDAYVPFNLQKTFDIVSCVYALHFVADFPTLKQACQNIYNPLAADGLAVVLDITHDYVYDKKLMQALKALTMYEYDPGIPEGKIPQPWQKVKGYVHSPNGVLRIDHIAIHGTNLIRALQEAGFNSVERKALVHANEYYMQLWGPEGFNHHLLFCRKAKNND